MNPQDQANNPYNYQQWGMSGAAMQNMQNMQEAMPGQGMGYGMSQQQMQQYQQMMMMQQMAMQQQMGAMSPQMLAAMQAQAFSGQVPQSGASNGLNASAPEFDPTAAANDKAAMPAKEPTQLETVTVGLFLEEIAYFLEDMEKDLWWLLRMAHQPAGVPELIHGDETIEPVDAAVEAAIQKLKERASKHVEDHSNQVRAKIVIIPSVDRIERSLLNGLRKLKFHCQGQVEVFPCMKEANNAAIWQAYFNCVVGMEPQWMMKSDGPGAKGVFARSAALVPIYVDRNKKEIKVFNVFCSEKKRGGHWSFLESDVQRGADRHIYDTCRRIFHNKVGHLFGKEWSECFLAELPQQADADIKDPSTCSFVKLEQDGHQYPCRPHFFLQVTEDFYETTRCYEDAGGVIKLPKPQGDFVTQSNCSDSPQLAKQLHLDGTFFMVHEEARWVILEYSTGKLLAEDTKPFRKENGDLLRSQPEKVWKWLAERAGLDMVQRNSGLPDDFPEDGPFSVRMSGIDKTATDDDIEKYFEEKGDLKVKSVEQFDVPRHTARIDFHDKAALEVALQLSGHSLLRRKVKVELWTDDPGAAAVMGTKPLKPYTGALPEEGPFKVIVKGLDKSVTQRDLGYFFWDRDCECEGVVYPLKNERHAGTVEFKDQESLRKALGLNSAVFKGREITVSLMTKEDSKPEPARRLGGPGPGPGAGGGGGKGMGKGRGDDRGMGRREDRGPPSRAEFGSERPRLELKPRSKPMPGEAGYREDSPPRASGRPDPFGGARHRTTRADADDNWRR